MTHANIIQPPRVPSQSIFDAYTAKGWWGPQTFGTILEDRAQQHPDREAMVDAYRRVTYGQLWGLVRRFAEYLRQRGIGRGDVVTLQMPNRIEFAVVFFSLELVGAVANKISSDLRATEVEYILRFSKSKAYVCAQQFRGFDYTEMIRGVRTKLPELGVVVCTGSGDAPDMASFERIVEQTPEIPERDRVRMAATDVMRMCFTSGTTGNPKGVLHDFNTTLCAARILNKEMRVTENDVLLCYLPVGLNWGYLTVLQAVLAGARAVLLERFSAAAALELIERERVTYIPTAPASIVAMLNADDLQQRDVASLRVVITGGASASIEAIKAFHIAFPNARLIELYGMLETGFHTFTRLDDDPLKVNGTIGRCVDELELAVLDEAGKPVPYGEPGELAARGPSVHLGYLNNDQANRDSFTADDWFRTGDLGYFADAAGNVRISGRKKEIINRGGKKYFPREIEDILYEHPAFFQIAIVGMPDERLGERNCLCAVLKPGCSIGLDEIVALLKGRVADYKLPEQLVLLDELPMTPTGKVRRPQLIELVLAKSR